MSVKMKLINFLALVALAMTSPFVVAQEAKTVVNYHTTVERMFNLEDGMTLSQVNETLGSEPYDLLQNTQGGYLMLEYKYLKAHRKLKASEVDTESGRVIGVPHYKDASSAYLMFNNENRLVSYVTSDALGELEHQYKLEATARALGSVDAPCTRNCRIAIPGQEVVAAGEAEAEVEEVDEEEPVSTGLSGLFGGVRDKIASVTSEPEVEAPASNGAEAPAASEEERYSVGDLVWIEVRGNRVKGQVIQILGSRGLRIRYVDPEQGPKTTLLAVNDVWPRS